MGDSLANDGALNVNAHFNRQSNAFDTDRCLYFIYYLTASLIQNVASYHKLKQKEFR